MKLNKFLLFVVLGIAVVFNSCDDTLELNFEPVPENDHVLINANPPIYPHITSVLSNQMVVDLGGSDLSEFEIIGYDKVDSCSCGDPNLKLLTFRDGFDVETAVATVRKDDDSRVLADRNYEYGFPVPVPAGEGQDGPVVDPNISTIVNRESLDLGFIDKLDAALDNEAPVIAIVDTGIYPNAFRNNEITLSKSNMACGTKKTTGWNFVDDNDDLYDDSMHGTLVAKRIAKRINELDKDMDNGTTTEYNILPLKVFSAGKGDYFNVVCAFSYIQQLVNNGVNVPIINASFGSNLENLAPTDLLVLKRYIDTLNQSSIIVASAGNERANNDLSPHFPSGYNYDYNDDDYVAMGIIPSNNIIAVAGYVGTDDSNVRLATATQYSDYGSNYGETSVDLAAPWRFPLEETRNDEEVSFTVDGLQGTSFSAAYVSGDLLHFLVNKTDGITTPNPFPAFLDTYYDNDSIIHANYIIGVRDNKYVK